MYFEIMQLIVSSSSVGARMKNTIKPYCITYEPGGAFSEKILLFGGRDTFDAMRNK
jgi:hypothetical protein